MDLTFTARACTLLPSLLVEAQDDLAFTLAILLTIQPILERCETHVNFLKIGRLVRHAFQVPLGLLQMSQSEVQGAHLEARVERIGSKRPTETITMPRLARAAIIFGSSRMTSWYLRIASSVSPSCWASSAC